MLGVSLVRLCFFCFLLPKTLKEEDKKKEKEKAKEIFRPSGLLSACFGNPECVSETKRVGSFLLALLACFCLLAFVGVLALLASRVFEVLTNNSLRRGGFVKLGVRSSHQTGCIVKLLIIRKSWENS